MKRARRKIGEWKLLYSLKLQNKETSERNFSKNTLIKDIV